MSEESVEITMKSVISILGSGWLGLPLATYFKQQGHRIRLSSRDEEKCAQLTTTGFDMHQIDIENLPGAIESFLDADILIITITSKSLPAFCALRAYIEASPVQHVLFISSTSVYQNLNRLVSEDEQAENTASSLYQIEQTLRTVNHYQLSVLRLSGLIGPNRHPGRFFRGGKIVKQPSAPINLIHRDDCIGIIAHIIEQQAWNETFNGCADSHPSKQDFYSHASQQLGLYDPDFAETATTEFKLVSNQKVKQHLGYQFIYPDLMQLSLKDYE